jgi:diacylglycerol kinase family enzyme
MRRLAAIGSLAFATAAAILAVVLAVERFPRGIAVFACLILALIAGWLAIRNAGVRRLLASGLGLVALVGAFVFLVDLGDILADLAVVVLFGLGLWLARIAFRVHVELPRAPTPGRPVLFFNPLSGGGKATRFHLVEEARRRGIVPIELGQGEDLRELVEGAIEDGADALAMAGGDGSQAIVAQIAAERELPYACIPAGTRNHFALDLGVDRNDVVGALDAFVDGGERRVDLAEVNGRVFVNNVSIGVYAEAVQRPGYRNAKLRTLLDVAPEKLGSGAPAGADGSGPELRWRGPDGERGGDAVALLVSNNAYRLGAGLGSGTRPHLEEGVLGLAAATAAESEEGGPPVGLRLRQWRQATFVVDADGEVPVGIDGEAMTLDAPLEFASLPGVLAVRISPRHPGASPSTVVPQGLGPAALKLAHIAISGDRAAQPPAPDRRELQLESRR